MGNKPLVSVVVVTYNSSATITETLESIYKQDYQKIELIVSDDCSKDDTIKVCNDWFEGHSSRFVACKVVETEKNTGVSANLNRGVKASYGTWIKTIAGDDLMAENAISTYLEYADKSGSELLFAKMRTFPETEQAKQIQEAQERTSYKWLKESGEQLYRKSLVKHILPGPGIFYTRHLYDNINGFDERYPFTEEWAFENKAFKNSSFCFIDKELVFYRITGQSLSTQKYDYGKDPWILEDIHYFFDERRKLLLQEHMYLTAWHQSLYFWAYDRASKGCGNWIRMIMILSPLSWLYHLGIKHE